jgi:DNA primase
VTAAAAEIFVEAPRRAPAISYLHQRGIDTRGLSSDWVLGYAPPGWTRLVDRLRGRFPDQVLLDAGLARRCSRGTLIDTFRHRVIFGIRQADGTIAGFIGRDLSNNPDAPKYLNTRQYALFDKGALLFGLHEGIRNPHAWQPVVVEGPLDVLAITARQQNGERTDLVPVAPCGTAFTSTHAQRIAQTRFVHQTPAVVAMDGDAAGRAAALAAGEQLRRAGVEVRIATLPDGSDPADYLAAPGSSLDAFHTGHSHDLISAHLQNAIAAQGDRIQWVEGRLAALRSVTGYIATYPPSHTARQVPAIATTLNLAPATVTHELADAYWARRNVDLRTERAINSIGM